MTPRALSPTPLSSAGIPPACDAAASRNTLVFESRVPEFAQPAWLALQRHSGESEGSTEQAARRERDCHTYAVMEQARPLFLLFFRREKRRVIVLNPADQLAGPELQDFSRYVFQHFPGVRRIEFQAQHRYIDCPDWRGKRRRASRLMLPDQPSLRLEEATRFNRLSVTYFLQRLKRDHPGFGFECYADEAIVPAHCRLLLQMNRPRAAAAKCSDEPLDAAGEELIRAMQVAGLVCLLRIEGRIVAGVLCCRVGEEWRISCLASDPRLQAYGVGMLCLYFTACVHADAQRRRAGATIRRPRYTHALAVSEVRSTVMTLRRPHASWVVRLDCALHATAMGYVVWWKQLCEEWTQTGGAFIRLMAATRQALHSMGRRSLSLLHRPLGRPAFLRGQ